VIRAPRADVGEGVVIGANGALLPRGPAAGQTISRIGSFISRHAMASVPG
jgi:hypothetical protein